MDIHLRLLGIASAPQTPYTYRSIIYTRFNHSQDLFFSYSSKNILIKNIQNNLAKCNSSFVEDYGEFEKEVFRNNH
jgi:hypothetical protein